jgi:hypothetical protein
MKYLRWPLLVVGLLAIVAFYGIRIGRADVSGAARSIARSDLRALAELQTTYHQDHGRYAPDLATLGFEANTTVEMRVDGESWAATAVRGDSSFPFGYRVECALVVGLPGIPWWGEIDMSGAPPGEILCVVD